MVNKPAS